MQFRKALNDMERKADMNHFKPLILGPTSSRINALVRLMQVARKRGYRKIAALCSRSLERRGIYVSCKAEIGEGLRLPHPTAIVVGEGVVVHPDVTLYQSVTLGGRVIGDWKEGNYPIIGSGTVLFAGVVVIGKVKIGRNCIVGANSVVLSDIPNNSVAVGAPARVVKSLAPSDSENNND